MNIDELLATVRIALEPDGWVASIKETLLPDRPAILIDHALSCPCEIVVGSRTSVDRHAADLVISSREVDVIRRRPQLLPHSALLGSLRRIPSGLFDQQQLFIVGRVLLHHELLTDDEARWLAEAGPVWGGRPPGHTTQIDDQTGQ